MLNGKLKKLLFFLSGPEQIQKPNLKRKNLSYTNPLDANWLIEKILHYKIAFFKKTLDITTLIFIIFLVPR